MRFREVIGQQQLKEQLVHEAGAGRIPHAQLLLSRPGTGGLPLAMAFAQYINCEQPEAADSCGRCPSCVKSGNLAHPDIHYSFPAFPLKSGKAHTSDDHLGKFREAYRAQPYMNEFDWLQFINAGNKQGNITAAECRHIIRLLSLKTFEGKYKVQIVWMAEALGKEGNILLKLLEEPPENTVLLLVVENPERVLNTIISRTQIKVLEDICAADIESALVEQGEAAGRARQLAFLADGNYHRALELQKEASGDMFRWLSTWLTASIENDATELIEFTNFLHREGREKVKHFLDYLLQFIRESLTLQYQAGAPVRLMDKERSLANILWQSADLDRLDRIVQLVEEKHYHIERNVNSKYVLLDLSIRTRKILRGSM